MITLLTIGLIISINGCLNCIFNNNGNIIVFLVASEVMFLGLNILYLGSSLLFNNIDFFIYGFMIIFCAISESVIGLGLCVVALKSKKTTIIYEFSKQNR